MIHINKFIDKIASMEGRQNRDVILTVVEARALRDDIMKIMLDQREQNVDNNIQVVMKGERW